MTSPYLDAILKLPVPDRLDLVEAIWDSLADSPEADAAFALTDEQRAELDRRLAEHLADPSSAIPWSDARRRLAGEA
jgi:putative addiction module component (TIGR02574 family)